VSIADRLLYALGNVLIYGPLRNVLGMSNIRIAYTAGAAIGPDLFRFYRSIGINLKQLYGQTETCAYVCLQPDRGVRFDTVGLPAPGVELRLAPSGEVLVRGPMLLKEYYKRPDATAESIDADGYFHTGDAGVIDNAGHLRIIDRAKDVGRLADGTIFAPNYIENKLKFFPHIKEAVAFGADRDRVCAFVNIDIGSVGNWAERRALPYSGYADLAGKPRRHAEGHIGRQQRDPFVEAPMIQQQGFAKQKVLDIVVDTRADGERQVGVRKYRRAIGSHGPSSPLNFWT